MRFTLGKSRVPDFEKVGYETMLATGNLERTREICALDLQAYCDRLQPEISEFEGTMHVHNDRYNALHAALYSRDIPVNDAAMLTHHHRTFIVLLLVLLTATACLAANFSTFYLMGCGALVTLFLGLGATALPLIIGHFAYENIVARNRAVLVSVFLLAVGLCGCGLFRLAEARRDTMDKAVVSGADAPTSYVDRTTTEPQSGDAASEPGTEANVHRSLGDAALWMMLSADLMLGLFVGMFSRMRTDPDYAAWTELKKLTRRLANLNKKVAELGSSYDVAQKDCMRGILKAEQVLTKRRPPYHSARILTALVLMLLTAPSLRAQNIQRYEAILIDTSGSIGKGGPNSELFREYLLSTKKLLLSEPPNTRVWVSAISTDSFGGVEEILKGWTPDGHGVFTDNLNRARRQLSRTFEEKSSHMSPVAAGTDIFGALWHLKALLDSTPGRGPSESAPKIIWLFSDMINETPTFVMPELASKGPEQMLEQAKLKGLLVPLKGYRILIYGASTAGLNPQAWETVRQFWIMYFHSAGAELGTYSAEVDVDR